MKANFFTHLLISIIFISACKEDPDNQISPTDQDDTILEGPKLTIEAIEGTESLTRIGDSVFIVVKRTALPVQYSKYGPSFKVKVTGDVLNGLSYAQLDNDIINNRLEIEADEMSFNYDENFYAPDGIGSFTISVTDKADSSAYLYVSFSMQLELNENDVIPTEWGPLKYDDQNNTRIGEMIGAADQSVLFIAEEKIFRSMDEGQTWSSQTIAGLQKPAFFALHPEGDLYVTSFLTNGIAKSTDNGKTWNLISTNLPKSDGIYNLEISENGVFYAQVYESLDNKTKLGIWKSENGQNWEIITEPLGKTDIWDIKAINNSTLLVGTGYPAKILKTSDGGITWKETGFLAIEDGAVVEFCASKDKIYAATLEGLFSSDDEGESWQKTFNGNPGNEKVLTKVIMGNEDNILISPTRSGVFANQKSDDGWKSLGTSLSSSNVVSMANVGGKVYIGTAQGKIFLMN